MYEIEFLKEAFEELKRLDRPVQELIKKKLEILAQNPEALKNNIKPLKGKYSGLYRLKVGSYRVIYRIPIPEGLAGKFTGKTRITLWSAYSIFQDRGILLR